MNTKYRIVLTCWDKGIEKPYADCFLNTYDSFELALESIETSVKDELETLNSSREKLLIEDSDGNIVGYEYPFRADYQDEEYDYVVRFWDGNDYQNVTGYKIYEIEDWNGYFVYRDFEIYPNKKGNRFKVESDNGLIGTMKHKLETALDWIDNWEIS